MKIRTWVGRGVLFIGVSSVQECPYRGVTHTCIIQRDPLVLCCT